MAFSVAPPASALAILGPRPTHTHVSSALFTDAASSLSSRRRSGTAPFELSRPTIAEYLAVLERMFLVERLPPWHVNRLSRLVKTPKLHVTDTGLAAALLGVDGKSLWTDRGLLGQLAETFVLQELRRQASSSTRPLRFHHLRDKDGVEVDIVIESGQRELAGIEVTASATVRQADFRGLQKLRDAAGTRFVAGVLIYDGERCLPFGDRLVAVPYRFLWE